VEKGGKLGQLPAAHVHRNSGIQSFAAICAKIVEKNIIEPL
jgi:hypothetical protein